MNYRRKSAIGEQVHRPLRLLTIAGSDSGGGAGIQADLKTFQALGGYGMSVVTALTAQNSLGVQAIRPVSPEFVGAQIDSVFSDFGVDVAKTGMLHASSMIELVAGKCAERGVRLVVDPVMVAKDGSRLLQTTAVSALRTALLPLATIATPNIPEAEVLTGLRIQSQDQMRFAAQALLEICESVLIKGGHLDCPTESPDLLATRAQGMHWIVRPRISTRNTHGTGCTYSAAIAVYLAQGKAVCEAVHLARDYVQGALRGAAGWEFGGGVGPLDHGWNLGALV
jgi:hydroxymethylpyrimidine/phosphomethylpyrimidine kinase